MYFKKLIIYFQLYSVFKKCNNLFPPSQFPEESYDQYDEDMDLAKASLMNRRNIYDDDEFDVFRRGEGVSRNKMQREKFKGDFKDFNDQEFKTKASLDLLIFIQV